MARLVFQLRSAGASNLGQPIAGATVMLLDSLPFDRRESVPRPIAAVTDSTGVAVVDSIPEWYRGARVRALGYAGTEFTVALRAGHVDTLALQLHPVRVCPHA